MKLSPSEDWGRFSAYSEIIKDTERKTEERIIKLLEERVDWLLDRNTFTQTAEAESWIRAIALIKGEIE